MFSNLFIRFWGNFMITYITAAYGKFFREVALKGMLYSFSENNKNNYIRVYVDEYPQWEAPANCEFYLIPDSIYSNIINGDGSFFSRTSFKFELMLEAQKDSGSGVCWIDCDSLVLSDIDCYINEEKIGVVSHGSCHDDDIFDCGSGLTVRGANFAIGGLFYLPYREDIEFLIGMVNQRKLWEEDRDAYWFTDGEQCLINHLVKARAPDVEWLCNNSNAILNWSFLQYRHPIPFDRGLAAIKRTPEGYFVHDRKVVVLMWTSFMLRRHIKQGFRSMDYCVSKSFRNQLYQLRDEGYKNWLAQMAYLTYDYLDIDNLRR